MNLLGTMSTLSLLPPHLAQTLRALATNFKYFAQACIKIQGSAPGEVLNLKFNKAQEYLHEQIEKMLLEKGFVRIIIVKGRQQGVSTYIEMRFFWKFLFNPNTAVCIISHEKDSSKALFDKAAFAYRNLPDHLKPKLDSDNVKEMRTQDGSKYIVLTAGSRESGRSQTAHLQHQSERAFFEDAAAIDAGAGQIVALKPGTEVYKESTANGTNHFHQEVKDALAGKGNYRVVFIPWYWEPSYREQPPAGFVKDQEEIELCNRFGLDDYQIQWRRSKIVELRGLKKFKQEYPFTLPEAFQASGEPFYDADLVQKAIESNIKASEVSPLVIGVDPGRTGDRTVITLRKGREVQDIITYDKMDQMQLAGILGNLIDKKDPDKVFIDFGMGHGTIDRLIERGYGDVVEGVHFGGKSDDPALLNKRAEMAYAFRDWLMEGAVSLPNREGLSDDIAVDIASMPEPVPTSSGKMKFSSKDEIRKEYGRSPDILDSIMLTFAYPVAARRGDFRSIVQRTYDRATRSELTTLNRIRDGENTYSDYNDDWYDHAAPKKTRR